MFQGIDERYSSMSDADLLGLVREHFKGERLPGIELLNRHFRVGYARAARLSEMLSADPVANQAEALDPSKPRPFRRPPS